MGSARRPVARGMNFCVRVCVCVWFLFAKKIINRVDVIGCALKALSHGDELGLGHTITSPLCFQMNKVIHFCVSPLVRYNLQVAMTTTRPAFMITNFPSDIFSPCAPSPDIMS